MAVRTWNELCCEPEGEFLNQDLYLKVIPRTRVGYETNQPTRRLAELVIIISDPTWARGVIVFFLTPTKCRKLNKIKRKPASKNFAYVYHICRAWCNGSYNPLHYTFVRTRLVYVTEYSPAKTGDYPNDILQFSRMLVLWKIVVT